VSPYTRLRSSSTNDTTLGAGAGSTDSCSDESLAHAAHRSAAPTWAYLRRVYAARCSVDYRFGDMALSVNGNNLAEKRYLSGVWSDSTRSAVRRATSWSGSGSHIERR
jgi:hypothetical protein